MCDCVIFFLYVLGGLAARPQDLFVEKYLEFPKRFHRIASFFDNRTTSECVQFYYLNKRALKVRCFREGGRWAAERLRLQTRVAL